MFKAFPEYKPKQPIKCRGCIWGNWDGMKQFCSKSVCIKESILLVDQIREQVTVNVSNQ